MSNVKTFALAILAAAVTALAFGTIASSNDVKILEIVNPAQHRGAWLPEPQ